jgi:hypothetical protein
MGRARRSPGGGFAVTVTGKAETAGMKTTRRRERAGLLAALLVLSACSAGATWTEYVYKDRHFAVAFTAPPKASGDGPFLVEESDGSVDFGVSAQCNIVTDKSPDQMLSAAIEASRLNGTVRNVTYTATGQTVGREMLVDRPGTATVRQRIFVNGGCLYLVFAATKDGPDSEAVTHFLDSFRLL